MDSPLTRRVFFYYKDRVWTQISQQDQLSHLIRIHPHVCHSCIVLYVFFFLSFLHSISLLFSFFLIKKINSEIPQTTPHPTPLKKNLQAAKIIPRMQCLLLTRSISSNPAGVTSWSGLDLHRGFWDRDILIGDINPVGSWNIFRRR